MNTFLPYESFIKSAQCLDYKRLGKQRVEAWQIYLALQKGEFTICSKCQGTGFGNIIEIECNKCKGIGKIKTAWYNHPIVQMWKGYEGDLLFYGLTMCMEWRKRGYIDNLAIRFIKEFKKVKFTGLPKWLGNRKFHSAMRSNLLRKDKKYYSKFGWKEKDNLPYYWIKE